MRSLQMTAISPLLLLDEKTPRPGARPGEGGGGGGFSSPESNTGSAKEIKFGAMSLSAKETLASWKARLPLRDQFLKKVLDYDLYAVYACHV